MNYKIVKLQELQGDGFLNRKYLENKNLSEKSYKEQHKFFLELIMGFSAKNFLKIFSEAGNKPEVIFWNNEILQKKWAEENNSNYKKENWLVEIILSQLKEMKPDILFFQNTSSLPYDIRRNIKNIIPSIKRVVIEEDHPGAYQDFSDSDIFIVDTPVLAERYKNLKPPLVYHAFDDDILNNELLKKNNHKEFELGFLGSLRFPESRYYLLKELENSFDLNIWADKKIRKLRNVKNNYKHYIALGLENIISKKYFKDVFDKVDAKKIPRKINSLFYNANAKLMTRNTITGLKIPDAEDIENENFNWLNKKNIHDDLHGIEYYQTIQKTKILLNKHGDFAGYTVDNIKMFEFTGMGSCLVTDTGYNMKEIFEDGKEVVTYQSIDEAKEKIKYLIDNPNVAKEIAINGQKRTLKDHTTTKRNLKICEIISNKF